MSRRFVSNSILAACAFASAGCGFIGGGVNGSGVPATESRNVQPEFNTIEDDVPADVSVTVGPQASVRVEGDDNIVPLVKTVVENGILAIKAMRPIRTNRTLKISITAPKLDGISLDGAGNVKVVGISGEGFSVAVNGAGNIVLDGATKSLDASLNGTGNLRLSNLEAERASVSVNGAGTAELWATQSLSATIDGVGNVRYKGNPSVTKTVNGVGRVEQL